MLGVVHTIEPGLALERHHAHEMSPPPQGHRRGDELHVLLRNAHVLPLTFPRVQSEPLPLHGGQSPCRVRIEDDAAGLARPLRRQLGPLFLGTEFFTRLRRAAGSATRRRARSAFPARGEAHG